MLLYVNVKDVSFAVMTMKRTANALKGVLEKLRLGRPKRCFCVNWRPKHNNAFGLYPKTIIV